MPFPISLDAEQYSALVSMAREGAKDDEGNILVEKSRRLEAFLKDIEAKNDIKRFGLWIQWQETDHALPPNTNFPEVWPPSQRYFLELTSRPIAKDDVIKVLAARAKRPVNVLVTRDPGALVGWSELDSYFVNG